MLKSLVDSDGVVWQALPTQYYLIESMPCVAKDRCAHELFQFLPTTKCATPEEVYRSYISKSGKSRQRTLQLKKSDSVQ